jgi:hypothetical protein
LPTKYILGNPRHEREPGLLDPGSIEGREPLRRTARTLAVSVPKHP